MPSYSDVLRHTQGLAGDTQEEIASVAAVVAALAQSKAEAVAAWAKKIGQRVSLEWSLVPLEGDAPAQEEQSASEGVGAGALHPAHKGGL